VNDGFTKLFSSILTSSIWSEDDKTRILWITILALTDQDGYCAASIPGLANMARLSMEDTQRALAKLESPDAFSRTASNEGRRLQKIDGGWLVLNHGMYRDRERVERRREYMRELMAKKRNPLAANEANKLLTTANLSASVSGIQEGMQGEKKGVKLPFDSESFGKVWSAWKEHRRKIHKPMTDYAQKLALAKLPSGEMEAIKWIENAIERGWQGIYEPTAGQKTLAAQPDLINTYHQKEHTRHDAF
jgi:hypothetical protein